MKKQRISTHRLVIAALMAALTFVGSGLRVTLPLEVAGTTSFHLGNILCALSGILLGPWLGGLAAGLGSAIYDMMNPLYISECWITFLTKGIYALAAGLLMGRKHRSYPRMLAASAAGAIVYALLYLAKSFFYNGLLLQGLPASAAALALVGKLPATLFNAATAVLFAPLLGGAILKALERSRILLN